MNHHTNIIATRRTASRALLASVSTVFLLSACDSDSKGKGSLDVALEAEDTVVEGLSPGTEGESIQDGWTVSFDKYIATVGPVHVTQSGNASVEVEGEDTFAVDLTTLSSGGLSLWSLADLEEGRWDFGYDTPVATAATIRDESVTAEDFDAMVAAGWTYYVDGTLSQDGGLSCPPASLATPGDATPTGDMSGPNDCYANPTIRFVFGAAADTEFGPCEIDEIPGVTIASDETRNAAASIHGDHIFFNGFPEGDEGGVIRLAQWMADCDLNLDGTVTEAELMAIAPDQLPEIDDTRYQLGGSPITPLNTMYDYLRAQLKTQGHFQGEGECAVDGEAHHDD